MKESKTELLTAVRTAPERIWLDLGVREAMDENFRNLDEVTWSAENATSHGVAYIRADLVEAAPADALDAETPFLQEMDQHLLHRFIETSEDDESYDISKDEVKRLANIGVLESCGFGRYGVTMFGYWVHERYWHQNPSLPLKTNADRDREKRVAIAAQAAQKNGGSA